MYYLNNIQIKFYLNFVPLETTYLLYKIPRYMFKYVHMHSPYRHYSTYNNQVLKHNRIVFVSS